MERSNAMKDGSMNKTLGFIGGGAILKDAPQVEGVGGVTTAASVWTTGAIGASIAHGYYTFAAVLTVTSLFVVEATGRLAARRRASSDRRHAPR